MVKHVLGIIGGTLLPATKLTDDAAKKRVRTPYGNALIHDCGRFVYVQRHGDADIPPHMINHRANIFALKSLTDRVIGVASVGSLDKALKPGTIVVPDDYIDLNPPTYFDKEIRHITPGFDEGLRNLILEAAAKRGIRTRYGGTYVQSRGPRLETKAEVRMFANFGQLIGMTIAAESTLACELGLGYAAICSVDNFANGLSKTRLDNQDIRDSARRNKATVEGLLETILEGL